MFANRNYVCESVFFFQQKTRETELCRRNEKKIEGMKRNVGGMILNVERMRINVGGMRRGVEGVRRNVEK